MKYLKITGLCLVSMFVMGMAMSSTAAAVVWEGCLEKSPTTRYREANCAEALAGGEWGWAEIKNTDNVLGVGFTIKQRDTKVPIVGSTTVICGTGGRSKGTVGPGGFGRIETAEVEEASKNCRGEGGCKAEGIKRIVAFHLPWQSKLSEEKGRLLATAENGGFGEPGIEIECETILGNTETDLCESEGPEKLESSILTNELTKEFGGTKNVQLVYGTPAKAHKAKCSQGGAESGELLLGAGAILLANAKFEPNGKGLRVH